MGKFRVRGKSTKNNKNRESMKVREGSMKTSVKLIIIENTEYADKFRQPFHGVVVLFKNKCEKL